MREAAHASFCAIDCATQIARVTVSTTCNEGLGYWASYTSHIERVTLLRVFLTGAAVCMTPIFFHPSVQQFLRLLS